MEKNNKSSAKNKIALAGFVRELNSPEPWLTMISEATDHDHKIEMLIIAYAGKVEKQVEDRLKEQCELVLIQACKDKELISRLEQKGVESQHISNLCEFDQDKNRLTEAAAINQILLFATLENLDKILIISDGFNFYSGIDFIEMMSRPLTHADVIASTAIPYRPDMEKILQTLQPYYLIDTFFMREYSRFIGQILMPEESAFQLLQPAKVAEYGNMFIDLHKISEIPAFFSQTSTWIDDIRIDTGAFEYFILQNQSSNMEILEVPLPSSISVAPHWSKGQTILAMINRIPFIAWNMIEQGMIRNRYSEIIENFESKKGIISLILKELDLTIPEKEFWEHWDKIKKDLEQRILQQMAVQESWKKAIKTLSNI